MDPLLNRVRFDTSARLLKLIRRLKTSAWPCAISADRFRSPIMAAFGQRRAVADGKRPWQLPCVMRWLS